VPPKQHHSGLVNSDGSGVVDGHEVRIEDVHLQRVIGHGANAVVFCGIQLALNREVAVKVYASRAGRTNEDRTNQALSEARKLANVTSEFIVSVYTAGRLANGWTYVVMELVDGLPLASVRQNLRDDFHARLVIWNSVYKGLDAAEKNGVYHGDLHDGNVIVKFRRATVIDFGSSLFAGTPSSLRRHAELVCKFARRLLPELRAFVEMPDIPNLVQPQYATHAVGAWVEVTSNLRDLEAELQNMTDDDLAARLVTMAKSPATTLINLTGATADWLVAKHISPEVVRAYEEAASLEVEELRRIRRMQAERGE
jgi:serine/threonine protein kinase